MSAESPSTGTRSTERVPRGPVIARVERTGSFLRLLERHRSRSGRPAEAARKAERILASLAAGAGLCPWEAGSLTRFGDARVPGCVKYELGGGYRLICRRRGAVLVALFLGNHEECHGWLRVIRGLEDVTGEPVASSPPAGSLCAPEDERPAGPSRSLPARDYTDRELRMVFAGLCGG